MTVAILLVAIAILIVVLHIAWVAHDIRWGQSRYEETLDMIDFDIRDIHEATGATRSPYREQMWRKPSSNERGGGGRP